MLTNDTNTVSNLDIKPSLSLILFNHYVISFSVRYGLPALQTRKAQYVLDYSKADFNGLSDCLLQLDFSDCYYSDDVEYVWAIIKQSILRAMLLYILKVHLKSQQTPKWFNSET